MLANVVIYSKHDVQIDARLDSHQLRYLEMEQKQ